MPSACRGQMFAYRPARDTADDGRVWHPESLAGPTRGAESHRKTPLSGRTGVTNNFAHRRESSPFSHTPVVLLDRMSAGTMVPQSHAACVMRETSVL